MLTTEQRSEAIHGLLLGIAIGDSLGLPREGLTRRAAARIFGVPPLKYRLWPGAGFYSDDTQLAFIAAQAVLQSRSQQDTFHRQFLRRLRWWVLSIPVGIGKGTFLAGLKVWVRGVDKSQGVWSAGNGPSTRALLLGVVLHNTGHRFLVWAKDSAAKTHRHPLAGDAAMALATTAQIAAVNPSGRLDSLSALETIAGVVRDDKFRAQILELRTFLEKRRSPRAVAVHFGWKRGISAFIVPTAIIAIYCFLRYSDNYRRAVESAIMLGGDTDSVGAIVGGLVGAHIGASALPKELVSGLADWPHDRDWIKDMADRLAAWPHGVDDLLLAPALPSYPPVQLLRNVLRWPLIFFHLLWRAPCWLRSVVN